MGFIDFIKSLFGVTKIKDEGPGDVQRALDLARAKEDREELFTRVDALYNEWLKMINDFDAAKESGKPQHVLEELYQQSKRLERTFRNAQEELRDVRDVQEMQERTSALQDRVERLVGEKAVGGTYTSKDEYRARKRIEEEMERSEQEDDIHDEQMRVHEARHTPPEFADKDTFGDDFDLVSGSAAGQEKSKVDQFEK